MAAADGRHGDEQAQRQLDILGFFFGAMAGFLDVEISEDAQQSRADFNAIPACQVDQAVQRRGRGKLHHHTNATLLRNCARLVGAR